MLTMLMSSPIDEETLSLVDTLAIWMGIRALAISTANNAWQVLVGIGDGKFATALLIVSQLSGVALGALLAFYTDVSSNPLISLVAGGTIFQSLGAVALAVREDQQLQPEALERRAASAPAAETSYFRTAVNALWLRGQRVVSCLMPQVVK
jgi:Na+-driven multidrug efflux pump